MTISFGGLATGLDSNNIVSQLMALEQQPITQLQGDRTWQQSRLEAFTSYDGKLKGLLTAVEDLAQSENLNSKKTTLSAGDFFTASAGSDAAPGNYQVEVVSLAQVEKQVSQGYADKTSLSFGTGTISLTVGSGAAVNVTIDSSNNSLEGIAQAINTANAGISAAVINDGTGTPYRLILSGQDVGNTINADFSGLSGGTETLPSMTTTQPAQQAHIRVDTVDIYSNSNTLTEAIPGVTISLEKAEAGTQTSLTIAEDKSSVKSKIEDFVKNYNEVVSFVIKQSKTENSNGGILGGDSGMNAIKRHLQSLLTTPIENSGTFSALTELGLETQKDGTLVINQAKLDSAASENFDDVKSLLSGDNGDDGLAAEFQSYLTNITDSSDGMLAGRRKSINSSIRQIDNQIEKMQARLAKREETLRSQFNALEQLVSGLNAQSSYLSQQLESLNNLWSQK